MIDNLDQVPDDAQPPLPPMDGGLPPAGDVQDPIAVGDPIAIHDPEPVQPVDAEPVQPVDPQPAVDDAAAGAVAPPIDLGDHDVAPPAGGEAAAGDEGAVAPPVQPAADDAGADVPPIDLGDGAVVPPMGGGDAGGEGDAGAVAPPIDLGDHQTPAPTGDDGGQHEAPQPPTVGAGGGGDGGVVPPMGGGDTETGGAGVPPITDGSLPEDTSTQVSSDDVNLIINVVGGDVTVNFGGTDLPTVVDAIGEATGSTPTPVHAPAVLDTVHPSMPEAGHVVLLPTGADDAPGAAPDPSGLGSGPLLVHGVDTAAGTMSVTPLSTPGAPPMSLPIAGVGDASQLSGQTPVQFDGGGSGAETAIALGVGGLLLIPVARRVIRRLT
jgi:hypothetical protein